MSSAIQKVIHHLYVVNVVKKNGKDDTSRSSAIIAKSCPNLNLSICNQNAHM